MQQPLTPMAALIAGRIATVGFLLTMVLQLLLALGIIPITMAWGGSQTVLTPALRIASLVAVLLLGFFAYVIRRRAYRQHPSFPPDQNSGVDHHPLSGA
ncbi:MAG: hypothetical protein R3C14_47380 [Caldilineaceae bacterium]